MMNENQLFYEAVARLIMSSWRPDADDESMVTLQLFIHHCALSSGLPKHILLYSLLLSQKFKSLLSGPHIPVDGS